jgi:acetyl-CoA carboxylase carboxyltransferase component
LVLLRFYFGNEVDQSGAGKPGDKYFDVPVTPRTHATKSRFATPSRAVGAEIGRAVVNFKGPIVFCVISRYPGGAYVVFSRALNEQLEVAALEGTYASVIGGAPAAAVVFAGEVDARTRKAELLQALNQAMVQAAATEKGRLRTQWNELYNVVYSEKLGEMAAEFDRVHSVFRALSVGALNHIIPPANLRSYLIDAVKRGVEREEDAVRTGDLEIVEAA